MVAFVTNLQLRGTLRITDYPNPVFQSLPPASYYTISSKAELDTIDPSQNDLVGGRLQWHHGGIRPAD